MAVCLLQLLASLCDASGKVEVPRGVEGSPGSTLAPSHPWSLAQAPLAAGLALVTAVTPAGTGHLLAQSLCLELVLLYGGQMVPGAEGLHTQVGAGLSTVCVPVCRPVCRPVCGPVSPCVWPSVPCVPPVLGVRACCVPRADFLCWCLLFCGQAAAHYLRSSCAVGQQHSRLTRDLTALAKTAVPAAALAAVPEALAGELQAAWVVADVRKTAAIAQAKGAPTGIDSWGQYVCVGV